MPYDAIIIGAGLSGLAAGIRLAMFDFKVCILEKHVEVGGLNSFYARKNRVFDVGLHAMTNFSPKGARSSPLGKLLKQLRFRHDEFRLCQQHMSEIRFPENSLRFTNDFDFLTQEVREQFPSQIDGFIKLVEKIDAFDELSLLGHEFQSSRRVVEEFVTDPVLIDMIFCPLMYYGNADEGDMDFYQFVIMFKSIFKEGFAKPVGGMHYILKLMVERYQSLGGELRMGQGVASIDATGGELRSVRLDSGETLTAEKVVSSMGYVETLRLCDPPALPPEDEAVGRMSFMECIFVLDREPREMGFDKSIIFFNTEPRFAYRVPQDFVDVTSGVFCCPNNFDYPDPSPEGILRLTNQANFDLWDGLARKDYIQAKKLWRAKALESLNKMLPDFQDSVVFLDTFTPKTIKKYTGHLNGAVYGSPRKIKSGLTPVKNLFICGTDQGFLGIIGATLSGVSMANLHVLKGKTAN